MTPGRAAALGVMINLCGCDMLLGLNQPRRGDAAVVAVADVAADATPDVAPDAAFDTAICPAGYTITLPSVPYSRYRLINTAAPLNAQHADCANDLADATHLIAMQTAIEATEVGNAIASSPFRVYTGAVQLTTAMTTTDMWFVLTGEMLPPNLWDVAEPEDTDGAENQQEQFAFLEPTTRKLRDGNTVASYYAMCECDGRRSAANLDGMFP
jgi:hypothetical protein